MDGFTMIDGIAGGVIFISAIWAYSRGFVREIMSILGWIAAAIVWPWWRWPWSPMTDWPAATLRQLS